VKAGAGTRNADGNSQKVTGPVTMEALPAAPMPTVEMIRGDKRATEVVK
jgi:hypothetical protein